MVSVGSNVAWWSRATPQREAMVYDGKSVTFAVLQGRMEVVAGMLRRRGICPGDVVAVLMKNSAAFLEVSLAVSHVAAVLLPINYRLGAEEVAYIATHAGVQLMFVDDELLEAVPPDLPAIVCDRAAQADSSLLAPGDAALVTPHASIADDLYRLMYTSGTTDRPKGVMHTYANMAWKCLDHITALNLNPDDRLLVAGPLYHVGAHDLPGVAVWMAGGCLVIERDFDADAVLKRIGEQKITGVWLAPVMLTRCLEQAQTGNYDLTSLRWVIGGGERTPEQRIRTFAEVFPKARYIDAYGLTESCSGDTLMEAGREIEKIGSTGRVLPHVSVRIVDDGGEVSPAGKIGEICLSGPKITPGYWKDPEKTSASFSGAWFHTGDMGYLDEEGFLFLTDRKKDMIISGGENIASSEVERVLYGMPQIQEVAAIGLPDSKWGECVTAVVVLREGNSLTLEEIREYCKGRLGGFKLPRKLIICESLPRNPSGKILKRQLRAIQHDRDE